MLKVIVADGHPTTRFGMQKLLSSSKDVEVVGECCSCEETLLLAKEHKPDVVVLGLNLLEVADGVKICEKLKARPDPPYLLVHGAYDFTDEVCLCLLAGADGYLHKRAPYEDFVEAVRKVGYGERMWDTGVNTKGRREQLPPRIMSEKLTAREREVLALILVHRSGIEIAHQLCVSTETIKTHTQRIFRKLGVSSRGELYS